MFSSSSTIAMAVAAGLIDPHLAFDAENDPVVLELDEGELKLALKDYQRCLQTRGVHLKQIQVSANIVAAQKAVVDSAIVELRRRQAKHHALVQRKMPILIQIDREVQWAEKDLDRAKRVFMAKYGWVKAYRAFARLGFGRQYVIDFSRMRSMKDVHDALEIEYFAEVTNFHEHENSSVVLRLNGPQRGGEYPESYGKSAAYRRLVADLYSSDPDSPRGRIVRYFLGTAEQALTFPHSRTDHTIGFMNVRLAIQLGFTWTGEPPEFLPDNLRSAWMDSVDEEQENEVDRLDFPDVMTAGEYAALLNADEDEEEDDDAILAALDDD